MTTWMHFNEIDEYLDLLKCNSFIKLYILTDMNRGLITCIFGNVYQEFIKMRSQTCLAAKQNSPYGINNIYNIPDWFNVQTSQLGYYMQYHP